MSTNAQRYKEGDLVSFWATVENKSPIQPTVLHIESPILGPPERGYIGSLAVSLPGHTREFDVLGTLPTGTRVGVSGILELGGSEALKVQGLSLSGLPPGKASEPSAGAPAVRSPNATTGLGNPALEGSGNAEPKQVPMETVAAANRMDMLLVPRGSGPVQVDGSVNRPGGASVKPLQGDFPASVVETLLVHHAPGDAARLIDKTVGNVTRKTASEGSGSREPNMQMDDVPTAPGLDYTAILIGGAIVAALALL